MGNRNLSVISYSTWTSDRVQRDVAKKMEQLVLKLSVVTGITFCFQVDFLLFYRFSGFIYILYHCHGINRWEVTTENITAPGVSISAEERRQPWRGDIKVRHGAFSEHGHRGLQKTQENNLLKYSHCSGPTVCDMAISTFLERSTSVVLETYLSSCCRVCL